MPNRILKESITTSCEIDQLDPKEEVFFYRLIVICDDFGRMDARPEILRAKCFPLRVDKVKTKDIASWITKLRDVGLIHLYQVDDKQYLELVKWGKHQQRRAKHSKYPPPDEGMISNDIKCNHMQEHVPEESRNRGIEKREYEHLFEHLWKLYPRKKGKGQVTDSKKRELVEVGKEQMEKCISRFKKDMQAENRPIDKMLYGSTFFNSGYLDYLDENYKQDNQDNEEEVPIFWRKDRKFKSANISEEENNNECQGEHPSDKSTSELWQEADEALQNLYKKKGIN